MSASHKEKSPVSQQGFSVSTVFIAEPADSLVSEREY